MTTKAKQRFLDLDVVEVSLVDNPANELNFLVLKNQSPEEEMGTPAANTQTETEVTTIKTSDEASMTTLAHVNEIVSNITKMFDKHTNTGAAGASGAPSAPIAVEKADEKKMPKGKMPENLKAAMKTAGATDEVIANFEKSVEDFSTFLATTPEVPNESEVEKAKSLSAKLIKALLEVHKQLDSIVQEVAPGHSPKTLVPAMHSSPTTSLSHITKAVADELTPALKAALEPFAAGLADVKKTMTEQATTIETLKSARTESNALGSDDTDKPVSKSKSLFAGLI